MKRKDNSIVSETILSEEEVSNDYELDTDSNLDDSFEDSNNEVNTDYDSGEEIEEFTPEDEIYQEEDGEGGDEEEEPEKKNKLGKIIIPLVIVGLVGVIGVLGYSVYNKYQANKPSTDSSAEIVEEPDAPDIYVSTVPTEKPTELPTPTEEPEEERDISEILAELEESENEDEEANDLEDSLDLESDEASLSLEEADSSKIKESYKDITVYFTDGLNTFHTKECTELKDKNKVKTTAYAALEDGYEECEICHPLRNSTLAALSADDLKLLEDITVYKTPSNTRYHKENCSILKDDATKITLRQAIEEGLEACPQCNPKTLDNFKDDDTKTTSKITPTPSSSSTSKTTSGVTIITPVPSRTYTNGTSSSSGSSSSNSTGVVPVINPTIPSIVNVTSLSLTGGTVKVGDTLQLTYTYAPSNANVVLTYSSLNTAIATISGTGLVKGVASGTVTITLAAPNGITAYATVNVVSNSSQVVTTPTPTQTTTTTPTSSSSSDLTLDLNNLGLTGVSQFIDPEEISLSNMAEMSDWKQFTQKVEANGGSLNVTSSSVTLTVGGVTRLQMTEIDSNHWTIRVYDTLYTYLNRCVLKAMCTKISSTPDTLYTSIYKDHEENEFIGERYRAIGDAYVKAEVIGGSTTYSIKDVTFEY